MITKESPLLLLILDGVGIRAEKEGNALARAHAPAIHRLFAEYPHAQLVASGEAVGLPAGLMGNSEVGHLNIGSGRVVYQDIVLINKEIAEGAFAKNPRVCGLYETVKANRANLHLIGLFSDGGVHSAAGHLEAVIASAASSGVTRIVLHLIMDGRDVPPRDGLRFFEEFDRKNRRPELTYATVVGRYWAMDRDMRWERVEQAFNAFVAGTSGSAAFDSPGDAIRDAYARGEDDEFIKPRLIKNAPRIADGDAVFCFNFRADRVRELTMAFTQEDFSAFDVSARPRLSSYLCMTEYKDDFPLPVAYPPRRLEKILAQVLSEAGLRQLKIAETEKYPHVTFFFNGGEEKALPNEERILIPSPRDVATYDRKPEMSAPEVTERLLAEIARERFEVIVLNLANGDMVGHTGLLAAAIKAVEAMDRCVARITDEILRRGGEVLIISDHGNCEQMLDEQGNAHTAHTTNPVPVVFVSNDGSVRRVRNGRLADVAPTLLKRLGIVPPKEMSGTSLI